MSLTNKLLPELRFPEFRKNDEWEEVPLDNLSKRLRRKVGTKEITPVSITAGFGFVDQTKKFGRRIAGEQYKNYIHIQRGDFVYNKGNSKTFAQGCIYQLKEFEEAAASTAFICFKLNEDCVDHYFQSLFECNTHGRQLAKFITSGARSDGLLNINPTDFFSIELPIPPLKAEQQKIADCLGSLDDLIAAHSRKLAALQDHKKGLLQQLFPAEGETTPKRRFPEFEGAGEWKRVSLRKLLIEQPRYGVNAAAVQFSEKLPKYIRITDISESGKLLSAKKASVDVTPTKHNTLKIGDIALARTGASVGKSYQFHPKDGQLVFAGFLIRIRINPEDAIAYFISSFINTDEYWNWVRVTSPRGGQPGINGEEYAALPVPVPPSKAEQQKIADCLSDLDATITAETEQIAALKTHKQGLMQQLFPNPRLSKA